MTFSPRQLTVAFSTAGVSLLALAAVVTLRADQLVMGGGGGGTQMETRIVTAGGAPPGGATLAPLPAGNGLIFGQTVDAASTRPVAGALVTLTLPGSTPVRVLADGEGRFAFSNLPKGAYNIAATKPGYVDGAYGRMRPQGQTQAITLADGDRVSNAGIALWKFAAVTGIVTEDSGEPMVGASVRILRRQLVGGKPRLTLGAIDQTDDRGIYRIGGLEPGDYIVCVPMSRQDAMREAMETLSRSGSGGVGMITAAMPVAGMSIGGGGGGPVVMNLDGPDDGAGVGPDGRPLSYPTQFYPNAVAASRATLITLVSGDERSGVDFHMRASRTSRISGVIMGPEGPAGNITLTLIPAEAEDLISPIETATAASDAAGAFTFTAVPPGQYVLRAIRGLRTMSDNFSFSSGNGQVMVTRMVMTSSNGPAPALPNDPTLWAETSVGVNTTDVAGVVVTLRNGLKVSGQLEFSGAANRPEANAVQSIMLTLEAADARTASLMPSVRGRVDGNGTFSTTGAVPGKYYVRASGAPQGWTFRGATMNGRDITDLPLEIDSSEVGGVQVSFTDKPTDLNGTVTSATGGVEATGAVILFPAEREAWVNYGSNPRRLRNIRTDSKGNFSARGIPAGRYYVVAVKDSAASDWQNVAFLEGVVNEATLVDLTEGAAVSRTLKVVR